MRENSSGFKVPNDFEMCYHYDMSLNFERQKHPAASGSTAKTRIGTQTVPTGERELGEGSVMRALLRMSLPAIGMMFLNTSIFLVDTIFVSWLGEEQMAAMSISLPVVIAIFAVMEGIGSGSTAMVGQSLGRGKRRSARQIAVSGLALSYTACLLTFPLLLRSTSHAIFNRLGAMNDPAILEPAFAYNFWWPFGALVISYTFLSNCVFRCQGDTKTPLVAMSISNVVNGVLDPILIFTLDLGIEGAAIATIIGRICAALYIFRRMKRYGGLFLPILPPLRKTVLRYWGKIGAIGFPVTLSSGSVALGFGWLNTILAGYGNYAVAAFMMSIRIEDFSFTVIIGVCSALTPFLAYNYGRRDLPRMIEGMKSAAIIASVVMLVLGGLIFLFPHPFIRLFRPSPKASELTVLSIRYAVGAYPFTIAQFIFVSLFVATGFSSFGTIAQIVRSIAVRIPAAIFFAWLLGERGIWLFQPASWLFGALVSWLFARYLTNRIRGDFERPKA